MHEQITQGADVPSLRELQIEFLIWLGLAIGAALLLWGRRLVAAILLLLGRMSGASPRERVINAIALTA